MGHSSAFWEGWQGSDLHTGVREPRSRVVKVQMGSEARVGPGTMLLFESEGHLLRGNTTENRSMVLVPTPCISFLCHLSGFHELGYVLVHSFPQSRDSP